MNFFNVLLFLVFTSYSFLNFANINSDFESLGSDQKIIERAKKLDPNNRYRIVQKRKVDRHFRLEVSGNMGQNFGGDSYYHTNFYGGQVDFHFTPRWSVGARYAQFTNELTSEGKRVFDKAEQDSLTGSSNSFPGNEYPYSSIVGVVNYYPIYGKLNFFNQTTMQFDVYAMGGAGSMQMGRGSIKNAYSTPTYVAGGGFGLWFTNYLTSRLEVKYQYYKEKNDIYPEGRDMHLTSLGMSIGFLF